ncbi:MAG: hypothetical protein HC850_02030 [Rhodomicrobium sp.]|nr:hypothetical protein [Rhodomicrobium sp.]
MTPLPIDNELDHTECARAFIEKHALTRLADRFPATTNFLTLDLTVRATNGYCFPDFAAFVVARAPNAESRLRVFGFELKVPAGISLNAVEQAKRQKQSLDAVFLLCLLPDGYINPKAFDSVRSAARENGIGIIRVKDWRCGRDFEILETPRISPPENEDAVTRLRGSLSKQDRQFLRAWTAA